jgi:hypothetical protein
MLRVISQGIEAYGGEQSAYDLRHSGSCIDDRLTQIIDVKRRLLNDANINPRRIELVTAEHDVVNAEKTAESLRLQGHEVIVTVAIPIHTRCSNTLACVDHRVQKRQLNTITHAGSVILAHRELVGVPTAQIHRERLIEELERNKIRDIRFHVGKDAKGCAGVALANRFGLDIKDFEGELRAYDTMMEDLVNANLIETNCSLHVDVTDDANVLYCGNMMDDGDRRVFQAEAKRYNFHV